MRLGRGQISAELVSILAIMMVLGLIVAILLNFFPSSSLESKLDQSKVYWSNSAYPFKISDWGLFSSNTDSGIGASESNLSFVLKNPTPNALIVRGISITPGSFFDFYLSNGTWVGSSGSLMLMLYPGDKVSLIAQHWEAGPARYKLGEYGAFNISINYEGSLGSMVQNSPIEAVLKNEQVSGEPSTSCPSTQSSCGAVGCCPAGRCVAGSCYLGACLDVSQACTSNASCCAGLSCVGGTCKSKVLCSKGIPASLNSFCADNCDASIQYCDSSSCSCQYKTAHSCSDYGFLPSLEFCSDYYSCQAGSKCDRSACECSACSQYSQECSDSSDCCDFLYCNSSGYCDNQTAHACNALPAINSTEYCAPTTCTNGLKCDGGSCLCILECQQEDTACLSDEDCCGSLFCNQTTHTCKARVSHACSLGTVPSNWEICTDNCPANYRCDNREGYSCSCFACKQLSDSCRSDSECCSGLTCSNGTCKSAHNCSLGTAINSTEVCINNCDVSQYMFCNATCGCECPTGYMRTGDTCCPSNSICGLNLSNFSSLSCCVSGYPYCANLTGTCCSTPVCLTTKNQSGTLRNYSDCCADEEACMNTSWVGKACCANETSLNYTQKSGSGAYYTAALSNVCNSKCCAWEVNTTGQYNQTCINNATNVCCSTDKVCLTGTPGTSNPFSRMTYACCASTESCGSLRQRTSRPGDQQYLCCPASRVCNVPAQGQYLAYTCCAPGLTCQGGNRCV